MLKSVFSKDANVEATPTYIEMGAGGCGGVLSSSVANNQCAAHTSMSGWDD